MDPSEVQFNPKKNWFSAHHVLGWLFLVVVAAAIVTGIYYWQTVVNLPYGYQAPKHEDATANWQTYTDARDQFTFKYPPQWTYVVNTDGNISFFPPGKSADPKEEYSGDIVVGLVANPKNQDIKTFYSGPEGYYLNSQSQSPVTINGAAGEKFIGISGMLPSDTIVIIHGDSFVEFTDVNQMHNSDRIFDKMTASFQSTVQASVNTGILSGHIDIGPFCPVEQANKPCPPPIGTFDSIKILVYSADGKILLKTMEVDSNGDYSFVIAPGKYRVDYQRSGNLYQHSPQPVVVTAGQTAIENFNIDTGIR